MYILVTLVYMRFSLIQMGLVLCVFFNYTHGWYGMYDGVCVVCNGVAVMCVHVSLYICLIGFVMGW